MTDDLDMGAILNEVNFEQAIQGAVKAGNDLRSQRTPQRSGQPRS